MADGREDERVSGAGAGSTAEQTTAPQADSGGPGDLVVEGVSHHYASGRRRVDVLDDVSFHVPAGKVACVVGPSGCGKSTLLSLAAGLQAPTAGRLTWDGEPLPLGRNTDMAMAFQQPGLFPWLTVQRNVAVGLETRGTKRREALARADEILETVGLGEFTKVYPSQLSGGMAQRVGIARALVRKPRLLLLDEPFAAVDAFTRLTLQQEFKRLLRIDRPTVLFVTHDVPEAIALGDHVVVMSNRPAGVQRIIPIEPGEKDKGSAAYPKKLTEILASLGVTEETAG